MSTKFIVLTIILLELVFLPLLMVDILLFAKVQIAFLILVAVITTVFNHLSKKKAEEIELAAKQNRCKLVEEALQELEVLSQQRFKHISHLYAFICKWNTRLDFSTIRNLGPDRYGIFRCDHMANLTMDNIYLGGVYGFNTLSAREWDARPGSDGQQTMWLVLHNLLNSNLRAEYNCLI